MCTYSRYQGLFIRGKRFVCVMRVWSKKAATHVPLCSLPYVRTLSQLIGPFQMDGYACMAQNLVGTYSAQSKVCHTAVYLEGLCQLVPHTPDKQTAWAQCNHAGTCTSLERRVTRTCGRSEMLKHGLSATMFIERSLISLSLRCIYQLPVRSFIFELIVLF